MTTTDRDDHAPPRQDTRTGPELSALECWSRSATVPLAGHEHDPAEPHILLGVD